jgi:protein-tyrosine phosphatase
MMARHVPLEGAQNFRDFGGYATEDGRQVKHGHLFRSGRLTALSEADHKTMEGIGIKLICDLRRTSESEGAPTSWRALPAPEMLHLPLLRDNDSEGIGSWQQAADLGRVRERMLDIYLSLVTQPHVAIQYGTLFKWLAAKASYPMLIHCSAGKDRTGVACALILGALGVSREDIIADYLLSEIHYDGERDLKRATGQALDLTSSASWTIEGLAPIFRVERAYLETALEAIEKNYGSARDFLIAAGGVLTTHLDALAEHLLERVG